MLAIIDGDVLAYQACRTRFSDDFDHVSGFEVVHLDEDGDKEFTTESDLRYLEECWENFKGDLDLLTSKLYCDDYLMAVKGDDNFRNIMYPDYKMNRHADPKKQNKFVPMLRKRAIEEGYAIPSDGREADDLLRIWAEECESAQVDYIVCSIDKDLRCIPGRHYIMHFIPEKQVVIDVSKREAMQHYYEQLLKGDPTDNIPGVPRVGEVKAKKFIAACLNEQEMQETVVEQYLIAYGDDWYSYFLSNAKMIHLQRYWEDYFTCEHWPIIQELR